MNAKLLGCIIAGVLVAHVSLLIILDQFRAMRAPKPKPVEPTFSATTTTFRDLDGKELAVVREFTVQTRMADKGVLKNLPKPPTAETSSKQTEAPPPAGR